MIKTIGFNCRILLFLLKIIGIVDMILCNYRERYRLRLLKIYSINFLLKGEFKMKKNIKIITLLLLTSIITTACTVMVKPDPVIKIKVQDDNGKHKGHYK